MQKFLVLYCMPVAGLEEWMKKPKEERDGMEQIMQAEWQTWMATHGQMIKETRGAGKTKRITKDGVADVKNDIMLYSMVEAESQDVATALFVGHPHLKIAGAWIDVMPANMLPGMEGK